MRRRDVDRCRDGVMRIALKPRPRHDLLPGGAHEIVDGCPPRRVAGVDGTRLGIVALEKRRIDVDAADDASHAETDDTPVVIATVAPPTRFPTVHPFAALGVLAFGPDRH